MMMRSFYPSLHPSSHFLRAFLTVVIFQLLSSQNAYCYEQEIKTISARLAENLAKSGRKTAAVVDFTDLQGHVTELGRFLAEELSVALAGEANGFEVIDRTHLKAILEEHKLSSSGLIDPLTARKLGQIAGVQALVTGTLTPFGDSVRLTVKILDTATAGILGSATTDIPKTKALEELLDKGISGDSPVTTNHPPSTNSAPNSSPSFETESYRVTVDSARKRGNTLTLTLTFECLAEKAISLSWNGYMGTYVLDENGERWDLLGHETYAVAQSRDSAGILWFPGFGSATLLPGTKIKTKFTFAPKGANTGTQFTLASVEGQPVADRQILIKDIK
jgi:TolB-like protein